jgi:hypothetical protein
MLDETATLTEASPSEYFLSNTVASAASGIMIYLMIRLCVRKSYQLHELRTEDITPNKSNTNSDKRRMEKRKFIGYCLNFQSTTWFVLLREIFKESHGGAKYFHVSAYDIA